MAAAPVKRVLIGIIDNGIAFAHERFRNSLGTRIEYLWQQDYPRPGPGAEIVRAQIDAALAAAAGDEDKVYRSLGNLSYGVDGFKPLGRRRSHGTSVTDLAAGADPTKDVKNLPIIAVDMPDDAVGDPAGSTLRINAHLALAYIMNKAAAMLTAGETLPVVVNLSYGPHEGPHDGSDVLEGIMDLYIKAYGKTRTPLKIVLAAGNSRQSRVHASFALAKGGSQRLAWRLQPAGLTASLMEIWAAGPNSQFSVKLTSPTGTTIQVTKAVPVAKMVNAAGNVIAVAQFYSGSTGRCFVSLQIVRTGFDPWSAWNLAVVESGVWTVDVTNGPGPRTRYYAWIRRSDTPAGHRAKGRQSYFDDGAYEKYLPNGRPDEFGAGSASYVHRIGKLGGLRTGGTLSGIATGERTVVIGGYRRGDKDADMFPVSYSSAGLHGNGSRGQPAPDWLECSSDSVGCRGLLAAGNRSESFAAFVGTSAAAPLATRWIAETWLSTGKPPQKPPLVAPKPRPASPLPAADVLSVVGAGLHPTPQRRGRPS